MGNVEISEIGHMRKICDYCDNHAVRMISHPEIHEIRFCMAHADYLASIFFASKGTRTYKEAPPNAI